MLPWMKKNQMKSAGVSSMVRNPDGGMMDESPEESDTYGLKHCAQQLIEAIEAKDAAKVAAALQAAFESMESAPHEEAESSEPQ